MIHNLLVFSLPALIAGLFVGGKFAKSKFEAALAAALADLKKA